MARLIATVAQKGGLPNNYQAAMAHVASLIHRSLSTERTNDSVVQLIRYTFVGGFAFIVDFSMLYLLTSQLGLHYLLSTALAVLCGLIVNYTLSIRWVFQKRSVKNATVEFLVFAAVGVVGLLWNEFFMWLFTGIIGLHYLLSKIISTFFVYLWNFIVRKFLLFN